MPRVDPIYLEHQLKRWMRPDAHLFVRPDWRRFVRPDFQHDHPFALYERKYSAEQPRVPAGSREGGQWTSGIGKAGQDQAAEKQTIEFSAARRKGHHFVATAVVKDKKISEEASKVFDNATTGPLYDMRSNKWDADHRIYNKAVGEALDKYLAEVGTPPQKMTAEQAREFLGRIYESSDPRIRNFNIGIQIREIMQRLLRRGGRE